MFKMTLSIQFDKLTRNPAIDGHPYDWKLDDAVSVLWNICTAIDERKAALFHVEGFGDPKWPVDVQCDLAILVEQLPATLFRLDSPTTETCSVDFFEQGIERCLTLSQEGDAIKILCVSSRANWTPEPNFVLIQKAALHEMCSTILNTFVSAAKIECPRTTEHDVFREWLQTE